MRKFDRAYLAQRVPDRWATTYLKDLGWQKMADGVSAEVKYDLILRAKTPDEIDAIIGNVGWTHNRCQECFRYKPEAVVFGTGYYSFTVCTDCLSKASAL